MGFRCVASGRPGYHGCLVRDDVRLVVEARESCSGSCGRLYVSVDNIEHVRYRVSRSRDFTEEPGP